MKFSTLWSDTTSSLEHVIVAIVIGVAIAAIMIVYDRQVIGKIIRTFIKENAIDEQNAKTLDELNLNKPRIKRKLQKTNSGLTKFIQKSDSEEERFYIPKDKKDLAEIRYDNKKSDFIALIITIILLLVAGFLCTKYIPKLLELFTSN